jgi:hypothetical protein
MSGDRDSTPHFRRRGVVRQYELQRADLPLDRRSVRMRTGALTHAPFPAISPSAVLSSFDSVRVPGPEHAVHSHPHSHAHAVSIRTYNAASKPFRLAFTAVVVPPTPFCTSKALTIREEALNGQPVPQLRGVR